MKKFIIEIIYPKMTNIELHNWIKDSLPHGSDVNVLPFYEAEKPFRVAPEDGGRYAECKTYAEACELIHGNNQFFHGKIYGLSVDGHFYEIRRRAA